MKLARKIEHLEFWAKWMHWDENEKPWRILGHSRKFLKKMQHRAWRRWSKNNMDENSGKPLYNRYHDWEY